MIPEAFGPYIGLPYAEKGRTREGADCWGGVRMVLRELFGHDLPDYSGAYANTKDRESVAAAVESGLADGWERTDSPLAGDLLVLKIAGRPWHAAILVNASQFLHWPPPSKDGRQMLSCIERLDSPHWAKRIEGIYRRKVAD
jgi:cell wall-associated NlpC family hydrolase